MLTYFRRNTLCAPHFEGGEQKPFDAEPAVEEDLPKAVPEDEPKESE